MNRHPGRSRAVGPTCRNPCDPAFKAKNGAAEAAWIVADLCRNMESKVAASSDNGRPQPLWQIGSDLGTARLESMRQAVAAAADKKAQ